MIEFWQTHGYAWVILPFFIFVARILDVSIATLRFMFLARGARMQTIVLGFFEALIWIIIISQVIRNLDNVMCYFAYAAGFAAGSYTGMKIEERLAIGKVVLRVIVPPPMQALIDELRNQKFGVTCVEGAGAKGPVNLLFMALKRSDVERVIAIINQFHPNAFYTIEDLRYVREGGFPPAVASDTFPFRIAGRWRMRFRSL